MGRIFNLRFFKNAGLYFTCGLAFFLLAFAGCKHQPPQSKALSLLWQNDKATAIVIPQNLIGNGADTTLHVQLKGSRGKAGILGNFMVVDNAVEFHPLIPLSPGLGYEVWQGDKLIADINLPEIKGTAPTVKVVYPQQDTLPENQLKLYISFSEPMQTGRALDYVSLLDSKGDTLHRVFLNLQPELWDTSAKVLTLWLDPGRIKRDLVLNRELGNPLHKAQTYQLVISSKWKDHRGLPLANPYIKRFTAGERDGEMPDINKWQITVPRAGTNQPLVINTLEPLDHYLLAESISLTDENGAELHGNSGTINKDKGWVFNLEGNAAWKPGQYQIKVNAKLEDRAGNNLNRIFDRDLRKDKQQNKDFFVREFEVK